MPTTFRATPRAAFAACLLVIPASGPILAADPATDEYEQARVERFADRIVRVVNTEHARWLKVLEDAYPGRVTEPTDRAGYAAWFDLLGGDAGEWRRAGSPTGAVAALFDRVVESRRLGPVPSISRAEFLNYAARELDRGRRRAAGAVPEYDAEADRVFRALDRDADGVLAPEEMTTAVRRGGLRINRSNVPLRWGLGDHNGVACGCRVARCVGCGDHDQINPTVSTSNPFGAQTQRADRDVLGVGRKIAVADGQFIIFIAEYRHAERNRCGGWAIQGWREEGGEG